MAVVACLLPLLFLASCNVLLNDVERRSLALAKLLTSESVDVAAMATMAGWPEGTDPRTLLVENGPHVSLVYVKNRRQHGVAPAYRIHNSELLEKNKHYRITVVVREKTSGPAMIVASIVFDFKQNQNGDWVLDTIESNGKPG
ncbi:MAG: hypothetical protein IME93_00310 [Proteobacteria bacterium]|nr:hypothetical protein [Pseudomonadota bacterium]